MIEQWMQGYLKAWRSDAAEDIAALFTADALYYTEPYAEPWTGRDSIVREWIARGDSAIDWSFDYDVIAECDGTAAIRGVTHYPAEPPEGQPKTYHNLWIVQFAPDGRARSFTEWWMKEKRAS